MSGGVEKTAPTTGTTSAAGAPAKAGLWTRFTDKVPFLKTKKGLAVAIIAILVIIGGGLAGLAALRTRGNSGSTSDGPSGTTSSSVISSDTHFSGQSPAVYPSRKLN